MDTIYGPIFPTIALWAFFALMVSAGVICIYRGMKNKNSIFYTCSGLFCFMAFAGLAGALGQYLLSFIMLIISAIASLFITPKIRRINSAEYAKDIETVDASEPIRFKEIFSNSFL